MEIFGNFPPMVDKLKIEISISLEIGDAEGEILGSSNCWKLGEGKTAYQLLRFVLARHQ